MLGITTKSLTNTNQLLISVPDELKGIELQIIILPANNETVVNIDFFSLDELNKLPKNNLGTIIKDNEDYSKW